MPKNIKSKKRKKRYSKRFATRPTKQQLSREKRARRAAIKLIAKDEKITIKEAIRIYKDQGLVEFLFERPKKYARRRFVKISATGFREIPEGKPAKEEFAQGPVRDFRYVVRVRRMKEYWNFVDVISQEYGLTVKQARRRISKGKGLGLNVRAMQGFYSGEYPISNKAIRELFG